MAGFYPVVALVPSIEVIHFLALTHVEPSQSIGDVFRYVAVHDIQQNQEPVPVGRIDQPFQILGGPAAAAHGKGAGDVVAKRCIVHMLLDCHELNGVVPLSRDPWDRVLCQSKGAVPHPSQTH